MWSTLVVIILAIILPHMLEAGRPIQEDPRSGKDDPKKLLVFDAPDDENALPRLRMPIPSNHKRNIVKTTPTASPTPPQRKWKKEVKHQKMDKPTEHGLRVKFVDELDPGDAEARARRASKVDFLDPFKPRPSPTWYQDWLGSTQKYQYSGCLLGLGYAGNPSCLGGEVCVDDLTGLMITTCSTPATPCTCTATGSAPPGSPLPPQSCGKGCPPDPKCAMPPPDGICTDSTFPTDDYVDASSTEKEPTPMVFFPGTLRYNETCVAYGDAIDTFQRGTEEFNEKAKKLRTNAAATEFGSEICNWQAQHLECIPDEPRATSAPTGSGGNPPTQAELDKYAKPKGSCRCMLALGEQAVMMKNDDDIDICYIPANRGHHSDCDHEIYLPYGGIEAVRRNGEKLIRSTFESASKFCVPNAECRTGYKYTGVRCQCMKKTKWDPRTSTCSKAAINEWRAMRVNTIVAIVLFSIFS